MMKNREKFLEIIRYLIVGVLTTVVSLVVYYGLSYTVLNPDNPLQLQIANVISWIFSVAFAYVTNRVFVFKSKNENHFKEITSFVGSRVVTLLMDMAIMFFGVTLFHINDKIVKLASQVIVIILNYVFSKLFVFRVASKDKKDYSKIWYACFSCGMLFLPILLFARLFFPGIRIDQITFGYFSFLFFVFSFSMILKKKHCFFLGLLVTYVLIQLCYIFMKDINLFKEGLFLLELFICPAVILFFQDKRELFNSSFIPKLFFFTLFLFFIPFGFEYGNGNLEYYSIKNQVTGILCILLPFVLQVLYHHKNLLAKSFGLFLILGTIILWGSLSLSFVFFLSVLYLIFRERKDLQNKRIECFTLFFLAVLCLGFLVFPSFRSGTSFENFFFDNRITLMEEKITVFEHANIEEKLFGLSSLPDIEFSLLHLDFVDIFYHIGVIGFILYFILLGYSFLSIRIKDYQRFGILIGLCLSFFSGSIFTSAFVGIFIGCMSSSISISDKKKILLVTNMYPSKRYPHYGSFVKNTKESLEHLNFQVDLVYKTKQDSFLGKFVGYLFLYLKASYRSIFYSYDYYYVHFVSLSTFPVLLGKWTSFETKLICNAHGNDIVPDYQFEEKNVRRSKFVLKFADIVVCPSSYFKDVLETEYHIDSKKIKIYPSGGIDFSIFTSYDKLECKKELGLDTTTTYYGYVSRIEKDKGWDTLLYALRNLKKENFLNNIKVLVIGTGSEQKEFLEMVKEFHLEDIIIQKTFVFQEQLVKYYYAMDLFLFPTRRKSESLGLVGLEAMASKTFVIGCNLYGPREYLVHGKNSLTFGNDQDGKELSLKIKEFQKLKKQQKDKITENAYKTALSYDKRKFEVKLKEIF